MTGPIHDRVPYEDRESLITQIGALRNELDRLRERGLADARSDARTTAANNERLAATLREARDKIVSLKNEVDRLAQPPASFAVFLAAHEEQTADIFTAGRKMRVSVSPDVDLDALTPGKEEMVLEEVPDIDYSVIGGLGNQIEAIRDAVELPFLHKELFDEHELKAPKGILLYGPPGCGKTLIAKAVANSLAKKVSERTGEEGRSFFLNIKGPELLNKYVGETERHIRLVFQRARDKASDGMPVIVFFDEMDSIFRTRGSGVSSDVENTIVPQLLSEIDG